MKQRRVVVTGIGTLNPLGNNIEEYFTNLANGVSGAGPITHFDASNFPVTFLIARRSANTTSTRSMPLLLLIRQ